jgi:hypothetical protein
MAIAQQSSSSANSTQHSAKAPTHTMTGAEFAQWAAEANLAEVKLGNLAEQQGTTRPSRISARAWLPIMARPRTR